MQLDLLLTENGLPVLEFIKNLEIKGLTCNSQEVKPGYIFVALKGLKQDGHQFIPEAVRRGAGIIVGEENLTGLPVPYYRVEEARKMFARLAASYYRHPSKQLTTIGVTGTNGKTTTSMIIDHILKTAGLSTGLLGTLYNRIGEDEWPATLTTPDALTLQSISRQMVDKGITHLTMEVSSHSLSLSRVEQFDFNLGLITNLTRDHLDWHSSEQEYAKAKSILFSSLSKKAAAIANKDDAEALNCTKGCQAPLITYGLNPDSQVRAENVHSFFNGTVFDLVAEEIPTIKGTSQAGFKQKIFLPLPGKHNLANALAASSAALTLGIEQGCILKGLNTFPGVTRRFELIQRKPYQIIDDCAHNPANLQAVFQLVSKAEYRHILVVYGIRGNRGVGVNRENSAIISRWAKRLAPDKLIITSCTDTACTNDKVLPEEKAAFLGVLNQDKINYVFIPTLEASLSQVIDSAAEGDLVLLLGAHPFDGAAELYKKLLAAKAGETEKVLVFGQNGIGPYFTGEKETGALAPETK